MKLAELAARLDCRLEGDGDVEITRVAGIHDAGPGDVTFLANRKYEKAMSMTRASAVIARDDAPGAPCALLRARDPYLAFAKQSGAAPEHATKQSHKAVRDQFKACSLAVQYGMGPDSLAYLINHSSYQA